MPENTPAPRFEWIEASYTADGTSYPATGGVVDRERGLFAPFGYEDADWASSAVAAVASHPDDWEYADTYTPITK
ncbi:hypothetical protein SEA_AMYEV_56 [Arthrobacter phage Amyev]|uniref:Uncharacterized protein n=1 Tax=Arthrobacter phage Amyev TaxID=2832315 RepID=A0AA49B425_9CAUD|nr:hypothetical protein PQD88_gp56 [Arthrobacter phage Amyev]UIW13471.1 hypothetical protein SEA_AMYEV_56 [Arthrobacter phage Amyev]